MTITATYGETIEINAPIEKVWETVMDPHQLQDWVSIHRAVRNVSEEPSKAGSTGTRDTTRRRSLSPCACWGSLAPGRWW